MISVMTSVIIVDSFHKYMSSGKHKEKMGG